MAQTQPASIVRLAFLGALLIALAACGDDSSSSNTPAVQTSATSTTSDAPDVGTDTSTDDSGTDSGDPDVSEASCPAPQEDELSVVTQKGLVRGVLASNTLAFRGIPYAAPPVGDLRWRPPQEAECFDPNEGHDASAFGPVCPQGQGDGSGPVVGDEDCLHLNVWTPYEAPEQDEKRPVMVFIHGGANIVGSSAPNPSSDLFIYDGQRLSERTGNVVVTFNYRLGSLGWLVHPGLDAESDDNVSGNYGTQDQIAALRWIRDNIEAFGGDPDNVLVFGESAGGLNTCMLMVTPESEGLFQRALIQSGGCPGPLRENAEALGAELVEAASCNDAPDPIACMRDLSPEELFNALPPSINIAVLRPTFAPHVDGVVIPDAPVAMIARGEHHAVPFAIGANSDETSRSVPPIPSEEEYQNLVRATLGITLGNEALAVYPASDFDTPQKAFIQLTTDAQFVCPSRTIARLAHESGRSDVYRYIFSHALDRGNASRFGAWHGLELLFIFTDLRIASYIPTADELALADAFHLYWGSFAATGDPGDTPTTWGPYNAQSDPYINLDGGNISMRTRYRQEKCDFWDSLFE